MIAYNAVMVVSASSTITPKSVYVLVVTTANTVNMVNVSLVAILY